MKTVQEINAAILSATFTTEELQSLQDAVAFVRAQKAKQTRRAANVGNKASFVDRQGVKQVGQVVKVGSKNIYIKVGTTVWRVSAQLVTVEG